MQIRDWQTGNAHFLVEILFLIALCDISHLIEGGFIVRLQPKKQKRQAFNCPFSPQSRHSLVDVIAHSYGIRPGQEPVFSVLLEYLLALNPSVKNPRMALGNYAPHTLDFISHDPQTILCMNPEVVKARIKNVVNGGGEFALVDTARQFVPADPTERGMYEFLARVSNDTQNVSDFAGMGLGVLGYLSGVQNRAVGVNPSPVFVKHAERMAKLSRFAKRGGLLLTGFGVMGACGKIATTGNNQKKNEVLMVEGLGITGGAVGGSLAAFTVGVLLVSGPVGWGVALVASAVGGYFAQEAGKAGGKLLYDQYLNKVDLVSSTGIGQICR
jgi:hypothetical protein